MKKYALMILLTGWTLTSCNSVTSTSELATLQGNWELLSFVQNDGTTTEVPNPQNYTIQFNADDSVAMRVDCNRCNGSYRAQGTSIQFGLLACTLAACGPQSLDSQYLEALGSTSTFTRSGNELFLDYDGGTMRFQVSD